MDYTFTPPRRSALCEDDISLPPQSEFKNPLNFEHFIGKQISEIYSNQDGDQDLQNESKSIFKFWEEKTDRQASEEKAFSQIKKPKSQIHSNRSDPFDFEPQLQRKKSEKAPSHHSIVLNNEPTSRKSSPETEKQKIPGIPGYAYLIQAPKQIISQLKETFKETSENITEMIKALKKKENFDEIVKSLLKIDKNICQKKLLDKKVSRYSQLQTLRQKNIIIQEIKPKEEKNLMNEARSKIEKKIGALIQIQKKIHPQLPKNYSEQEEASKQEKGPTEKRNTLHSRMSSLSNDSLAGSHNRRKDKQLSEKLEKILNEEGPTSSTSNKDKDQKLKSLLASRKKRLVQQNIKEFLERKGSLEEAIERLTKQENYSKQSESLQDLDQPSLQKLLLGKYRPQIIDLTKIPQHQDLNAKKIEKINFVPENYKPLYYMRDFFEREGVFDKKKQFGRMSLHKQRSKSIKNSVARSNSPQNNSPLMLNDKGQKQQSRVDRDFSSSRPHIMTNSVMLSSKNSNQKPKIFLSTNFNYGKKMGHSDLMPFQNAQPTREDLFREAFQKYKPSRQISIEEYFTENIFAKCDQEVDRKLGLIKTQNNANVCSQRLRFGTDPKQYHLNRNEFILDENFQENFQHQKRISKCNDIVRQPKQYIDQSYDSQSGNQQSKQFISVGTYNTSSILGPKIKKSSKKQLKYESSPLQEWTNQFQKRQKQFQTDARTFLMPQKTTAQQFFSRLPKNESPKPNLPEKLPKQKPKQNIFRQQKLKIVSIPKQNKKIQDSLIKVKKAVSEDEENENKGEKVEQEAEVPTFNFASNPPTQGQEKPKPSSMDSVKTEKNPLQVKLNAQNQSNPSLSSNQTVPLGSQNFIGKEIKQPESIKNDTENAQTGNNQNPADRKESEVPPKKTVVPTVIKLKPDEPKVTNNANIVNSGNAPGSFNSLNPGNGSNPSKPTNSESNNNAIRQGNKPKVGFGQTSNIFDMKPSPSLFQPLRSGNGSNPQYPSFAPPQNFTSFGPGNNQFQQIEQQLVNSMGNFNSFGQGMNGFSSNGGGNIFQGQQGQGGNTVSNPFQMLQGSIGGIFGGQMQPPAGVTQNQMQMRK